MEPTPIFAALVAPPARSTDHDGHGEQRRTVTEILRALRAEDRDIVPTVPTVTRGRVGHVPGVLSFRPSPRV